MIKQKRKTISTLKKNCETGCKGSKSYERKVKTSGSRGGVCNVARGIFEMEKKSAWLGESTAMRTETGGGRKWENQYLKLGPRRAVKKKNARVGKRGRWAKQRTRARGHIKIVGTG